MNILELYKSNYSDLSALRARTNIKDFESEWLKAKTNLELILDSNPDCTPIFICITGSTAYSLDLEGSDLDIKAIYIQDLDSILKEPKIGETNPMFYKEQLGGGKQKGDKSGDKKKEDVCMYEIGRFIDLLKDNNPNILDLINIPDDCVIYSHPIWDEMITHIRNTKILSKKCYYTFFQYAKGQLEKATGQNKKISNPVDKERKSPIDFCSVIFNDSSTMNLRSYLEKNKMDQIACGLSKVPHARDLYALYYDDVADKCFSKYLESEEKQNIKSDRQSNNLHVGLGYKGIIKETIDDVEISNDIRISSIPIGETIKFFVSYNKDGYMTYCKAYREYWGSDGWIAMRNEERFDNGHGYNSKNLSHCLRLLYMAKEIAIDKKVVLNRTENRDELLKVKRGEMLYDDIMKICNSLTLELVEVYEKSDLPENVDYEALLNILFETRTKFYKNVNV